MTQECSRLQRGELVDHYEVQELIGAGSFGAVYKVEDVAAPPAARPLYYALKLLDQRFDSGHINEIRALYELRHPNIVSMVCVGEYKGFVYIVLELLHGCSLAQHLQEAGPLGWQEALELASSIADALQYAHARDIVHRDLHPGNVFLQTNGPTKVLDFGLAYAASETPIAAPGGAPGFMAPEVPHRGALSDIFSAGMVLYAAIRGGLPARMAHFTDRSLVPANVAVPTRSEIAVLDAPRSVRRAIASATRRSPEQRPQTMDEWQAQLVRAQGLWPRTIEAIATAPAAVWGGASLLALVAILGFFGVRFAAVQGKLEQLSSALGTGGAVPSKETWTVKLEQIGPLPWVVERERTLVAPLMTLTDRVGDVSFEMVLVAGPARDAGTAKDRAGAGRALLVGRFEVTRELWRAVALTQPDHREISISPAGKTDHLPVSSVSVLDVREFLARLRRETGRSYRLPTSEEWRHLADADAASAYPFGDIITAEYANFDCTAPLPGLRACRHSSGMARPVGSYGVANAFGIFDTVGNVWELAVSPQGQVRIHGGAYSHGADGVRSDSSKAHDADQSAPDVGFRIVGEVGVLQALLTAPDDDRLVHARAQDAGAADGG